MDRPDAVDFVPQRRCVQFETAPGQLGLHGGDGRFEGVFAGNEGFGAHDDVSVWWTANAPWRLMKADHMLRAQATGAVEGAPVSSELMLKPKHIIARQDRT